MSKIVDFKINFNTDDDFYDGGESELTVMAVYGADKEKSPKPPKYGTDAYWEWYYKYGEGSTSRTKDNLFSASINEELDCCAFLSLGQFYYTEKQLAPWAEKIGERLGPLLKQYGKYFSAYVPDKAQWKSVATLFKAAGFQAGMRQRSNHGKYTVTRWEYIPTGEKLEEIVSSLAA